MSVPSLLFIIVVYAFMPRNMVTLVLMLASFSWTKVARVVRAQTLTLKERDFVTAAKALGVGQSTVIWRHIIPNLMPQIIVASSLSIANAILDESALSFLGYGIQLPMASWGSMLQSAQQYILYNPICAVIPGSLILITVLCFNVMGDMLQQIQDPYRGNTGSERCFLYDRRRGCHCHCGRVRLWKICHVQIHYGTDPETGNGGRRKQNSIPW